MLDKPARFIGCITFLVAAVSTTQAATFRVATYNLENYVLTATTSRRAKTDDAKAKVRECIRAAAPDVLAVQEVGGTNALEELRRMLKADGSDFPHCELVPGFDTNIQVGVLSRFPIVADRSHTNESFLLQGRRFHVSRALVELDIQVNDTYAFTLFTTHLKSKRQVPEAEEADLRIQEAVVLREKIERRMRIEPNRNVVVLGDLNDTKDSPTLRTIVGRGKMQLVDTRPAERNGDTQRATQPNSLPRNICWTHYFAREDVFSRFDYLLVSPSMAREWVPEETWIPTVPNWGLGSDHRLIVATFAAEDR